MPLTSTGYFSNPENFNHFKDCAYSYLQQGPGQGVSTETAAGLKVLFERATQLGVYSRASRTLTWSEKLWTLGAYWGIQEIPWPYDEFRDAPEILCMTSVLNKVQAQLRQKQQEEACLSDPLRSFIRHDSDYKSPLPLKSTPQNAVENS